MQQAPRSTFDKLFGRPARRPGAGGAILMGIVVLFVASNFVQELQAGHVRWGLLPVLAIVGAIAGRQIYWAVELRNVSDEAIAHQAGVRLHPEGYPGLPVVPSEPGQHQPYRIVHRKGWGGLALLLGVAAFWNGITWTAIVVTEGGSVFITIFLGVFALVGLFLGFNALHELLVVLRFHPTVVELSEHPVVLGRPVTMVLSQDGPVKLNRLTVDLVCEEVARYRVGTNTRTVTETQHQERIFEDFGLVVPRGKPFVKELPLSLPERAMHSLDLENNDVRWLLKIEGDVPKYPDFSYEVLLCVAPMAQPRKAPYR